MTKEINDSSSYRPEENSFFERRSLAQLRDDWEKADNTPGEVVDGVSKGEIALEITRRVNLGEDN